MSRRRSSSRHQDLLSSRPLAPSTASVTPLPSNPPSTHPTNLTTTPPSFPPSSTLNGHASTSTPSPRHPTITNLLHPTHPTSAPMSTTTSLSAPPSHNGDSVKDGPNGVGDGYAASEDDVDNDVTMIGDEEVGGKRDKDGEEVDVVEDDEEVEEVEEDKEDGEGEAEAEGEEGEEDGEEESESEDEEDDEDDEDSSGDESEDLEGSPDIIPITADGVPDLSLPAGMRVKSEPADAAATSTNAPTGDATDAAASGEPGEIVTQLVPKKKKRVVRSPSEEEDLPAPPPPLPTIRVEWKLIPNVPLEVSFLDKAAAEGYPVSGAVLPDEAVAEVVERVEGPSGDAQMDVDGPVGTAPPPGMDLDEWREMEAIARRLEEKYDKPKKGKPAKKRKLELYDIDDPFIDDSDLKIDAPTHVARPVKEGFFVHSGALELLEESPAKPKARTRPSRPAAAKVKAPSKSLSAKLIERHRSRLLPGTQESPVVVGSDDEDEAGPSVRIPRMGTMSPSPPPLHGDEERTEVDRGMFKNASRDPKYLPPFQDFPEEVAHRLRVTRHASLLHKWDLANKGKFPEHIKPLLQRAGEAAFRHDLLSITDKPEGLFAGDDRHQEKAFVTALCSILPYNKLTLGKLVLKMCYKGYMEWLQACEKEGLREIKDLVEVDRVKVEQAYVDSIGAYKVQLAEWVEKNPQGENTTAAPVEDADGLDGAAPPSSGDRKPIEPLKRFPFPDEMREVFAQLLDNANEMADVNTCMFEWAQKIDGSKSDQTIRKELYRKICDCFPPDWMTSALLSREMTKLKNSKKKED